MDCTPGFSGTALSLIKQKVQEEASRGSRILLSLTFDEMSIRKFICLNLLLKGKAVRYVSTVVSSPFTEQWRGGEKDTKGKHIALQ